MWRIARPARVFIGAMTGRASAVGDPRGRAARPAQAQGRVSLISARRARLAADSRAGGRLVAYAKRTQLRLGPTTRSAFQSRSRPGFRPCRTHRLHHLVEGRAPVSQEVGVSASLGTGERVGGYWRLSRVLEELDRIRDSSWAGPPRPFSADAADDSQRRCHAEAAAQDLVALGWEGASRVHSMGCALGESVRNRARPARHGWGVFSQWNGWSDCGQNPLGTRRWGLRGATEQNSKLAPSRLNPQYQCRRG